MAPWRGQPPPFNHEAWLEPAGEGLARLRWGHYPRGDRMDTHTLLHAFYVARGSLVQAVPSLDGLLRPLRPVVDWEAVYVAYLRGPYSVASGEWLHAPRSLLEANGFEVERAFLVQGYAVLRRRPGEPLGLGLELAPQPGGRVAVLAGGRPLGGAVVKAAAPGGDPVEAVAGPDGVVEAPRGSVFFSTRAVEAAAPGSGVDGVYMVSTLYLSGGVVGGGGGGD